MKTSGRGKRFRLFFVCSTRRSPSSEHLGHEHLVHGAVLMPFGFIAIVLLLLLPLQSRTPLSVHAAVAQEMRGRSTKIYYLNLSEERGRRKHMEGEAKKWSIPLTRIEGDRARELVHQSCIHCTKEEKKVMSATAGHITAIKQAAADYREASMLSLEEGNDNRTAEIAVILEDDVSLQTSMEWAEVACLYSRAPSASKMFSMCVNNNTARDYEPTTSLANLIDSIAPPGWRILNLAYNNYCDTTTGNEPRKSYLSAKIAPEETLGGLVAYALNLGGADGLVDDIISFDLSSLAAGSKLNMEADRVVYEKFGEVSQSTGNPMRWRTTMPLFLLAPTENFVSTIHAPQTWRILFHKSTELCLQRVWSWRFDELWGAGEELYVPLSVREF